MSSGHLGGPKMAGGIWVSNWLTVFLLGAPGRSLFAVHLSDPQTNDGPKNGALPTTLCRTLLALQSLPLL